MWVWKHHDWPKFVYDSSDYFDSEEMFLLLSGKAQGLLSHVKEEDKTEFTLEILVNESVHSSSIEGEFLRRESVKSSLKKHFGLKTDSIKPTPQEYAMAELRAETFRNFNKPLTHAYLGELHQMLMNGRRDIEVIGGYRTHQEPMQIVSSRLDSPYVYYEAPPSSNVPALMSEFIDWFMEEVKQPRLGIATFASIVHLWFEQIHPFEDGNGRMGRALCEKAIAMRLGQSPWLTLSKLIEQSKKTYYESLHQANYTLDIKKWLDYHVSLLIEAQKDALLLIEFTLKKAKLFEQWKHEFNERQEKAILRIFAEGPAGFSGGLSSKNYQRITKASTATTTRDLQDLVKKGILRKEGELKATRYYLL